MDVRLSEEQLALTDAAARVVGQLAPHAVGEIGDPDRVARLDAAVATSGWREFRCDTGDGTPLTSGVEVGIVAEELGRGLADVPFLGPTLAAELRRLAGAQPADGVETVALVADLSALVPADPGESPLVVIDGQGVDHVLLLAPGPDGYRLTQRTSSQGRAGVDLTRPSMALTATERSPGASLGVITENDLARWTALGLSLTCADLVGTMRGATALACEYAAQRRQYGAPIGSFQAVAHMLADAYVLTEGARSVSLHASWAVDALPAADALDAAAVAKAYCARAARQVCETAIQVHGGIGNTWECLAHVYLRRALLSSDILGGSDVSLTRVLAHRGLVS